MRLISFSLLSFISMILGTSAILLMVGFQPMDYVYAAALSTPLTWLLAMWYCYWDDKAWRPAVVLFSISSISGVVVFLSPIPTV